MMSTVALPPPLARAAAAKVCARVISFPARAPSHRQRKMIQTIAWCPPAQHRVSVSLCVYVRYVYLCQYSRVFVFKHGKCVCIFTCACVCLCICSCLYVSALYCLNFLKEKVSHFFPLNNRYEVRSPISLTHGHP